MTAYFLRRLLLIIPTFIGVTLIVFAITRLVPGGPLERQIMQWRQGSGGRGEAGGAAGRSTADITREIPPEALEQLRKQYHLDQHWYVAYWLWLKDVATLNLGESYYYKEPVLRMVVERFPVSLTFGLTGFVLAYLVCIPLGIVKALRHGAPLDYISSALVFVGYSIPGWALGVLLLTLLASGRFVDIAPLGGMRSTDYGSLPRVVKALEGRDQVVDKFGTLQWEKMSLLARFLDRAYYMILPVICYMIGSFATLTVLTKNSLLENLSQDYVRTAFAKGLAPRRVILVHTLRNSLIPLATGLGGAIGIIMAGSYLIEFVFNIDGLGYLGYNALVQRDYAIVMGVLVINTLLLLFGNIISDFLYAVIDPRIRFE
ncbi:MAG: ABC transporter permease subunit [Planctomycetes bacterium]|nr:ABC transporter permease subunit [Planctomycetota bacterium]